MTTALYRALRDAGASDELAKKASAEQDRILRMETEIVSIGRIQKWIVLPILLMMTAKLFGIV